jgi:glucosamine--fructose-6-phosphate aminotransferase (isomerizing)
MNHAVVVGRGLNYANAFEFALKLMETSYVIAERFSAADFMHGPIAMVEANFPSFLFAPSGPTWGSMHETLLRLRELKAETVLITDMKTRVPEASATRTIRLPFSVDEALSPIPYIIPAQLFAAHLAAEKNLDPDRPRTLSKVTLTL